MNEQQNVEKDSTVLIGIPSLVFGGTEYQTRCLVKALVESGYEVHVVCYFEYDNRMVEYYEKAGSSVSLLKRDGVRPWGIISQFIVLFFGIRKILKKVRADIVHVQLLIPWLLPILAFKLNGVSRILATAHVSGSIIEHKKLLKYVTYHLVEFFICVSENVEKSLFGTDTQRFIAGKFSFRRKHYTIYNCVETSRVEMLHFRDKTDGFTLGVVARLCEEKGVDVLIRALPMVLRAFPNTKVLVVGDGEEREPLMGLAQALEVDHAVSWEGFQPEERLEGYYSSMDLLAVPSRMEGFGLTAIEAMARGIPVVASSVDGLVEVIENGESGVLVDADDPVGLAEGIVGLFRDNEKRRSIGIAGRARVESEFDFGVYRRRISEFYGLVLADERY